MKHCESEILSDWDEIVVNGDKEIDQFKNTRLIHGENQLQPDCDSVVCNDGVQSVQCNETTLINTENETRHDCETSVDSIDVNKIGQYVEIKTKIKIQEIVKNQRLSIF